MEKTPPLEPFHFMLGYESVFIITKELVLANQVHKVGISDEILDLSCIRDGIGCPSMQGHHFNHGNSWLN